MPRDTLLLVCRESEGRSAVETHRERLRTRGVADAVEVARYQHEPVRELRDRLAGLDADRVFAIPMCLSHSRETTDAIPSALSAVSAPVTYCEPVGHSPAVTGAVLERATSHVAAGANASIVLVGFGSGGTPYNRQAVEYHAARIRRQSDYGEVMACYLMQNPAVECVRYNVSTDRAVAAPMFVDPGAATEEEIPAKLELERGGIEYADPLGDHSLVTDAIEAEVARQRVLTDARRGSPHSFEAALRSGAHALASDGEGEPL
ncbi:Sirohydrochlorin ferrochelatase [Halomicrobium zhouii]|uniref:Sirohydrochlorin ferrochelatase n=1 Tax=Halomicrobium zhouii TaxID=767519 RepID=A0A1I6LYX2_9EURY|nr:CbiX/SirB N-terminal domain-containing protein [Halomicrobium zhouii]SFS08671.1 Sirohydrochlorin ferrochelatase [Halomicrobium zhouii]